MDEVKFALVGCGRIAKRHSELLGYGEIPFASLVAVCDIDEEKAAAIGRQFEVPYFSDMHAMARAVDCNAFVVLTESGAHARHVVELAPYGKHLVVEKPMALTLDDADEMIRVCDANGIRLFVVKQNRFNVPVVKLREALEEGRFGKLVLGTVRVRWCRMQDYYDQAGWRGTWSMDGGVLTNQASHHIDLLEWMMGDVESVHAISATALADIETEDTAVVAVKFVNGALGVIEATTAARPTDLEGSISVLGEFGAVEIGGFAVNKLLRWAFVEEDPRDANVLAEFSVNPPSVYGFGHQAYYEPVVACILNEDSAVVDGREGRKSLELITAIYESIETGKQVKLRFKPDRCRLGLEDDRGHGVVDGRNI